MDEAFPRGSLGALIAIPELNGAENLEDWIRKINDYLILTNQDDDIDEERPEANNEDTPAFQARLKKMDMTRPREILDTLEENSKVQGTGVLTELYKEYSAKLREIGNKLRNLGPEAAITNFQMIIFFLRELGLSFDIFQASFSQTNTFLCTDTVWAVTFDHTVMQAISEKKRQASQETTATATVATQLRPNKKVVGKLHPKLRSKNRKRTSSEKQPATEEANYWVFDEPPVRANMATTHEKAKPGEFILDSGCTKTSVLSRDHFRTYRTPSFLPVL
ncbi:MAG: hypothetical protein MMC33_001368 [Icmadophila ericetorum]|nr:hypothetical protein [Icmadophila ericetorum]